MTALSRNGLLAAALILSAACPSVAGPQAEVGGALQALSQGEAHLEIAGAGSVRFDRLRFERVLVKPEGPAFVAVATVDAEGRFAPADAPPGSEATRISYLGVERVPFERRGGQWRPRQPWLPALSQIVSLLDARRRALAQGGAHADWEALLARDWEDERVSREALLESLRTRPATPSYQPTRWLVRVERSRAEVLEERLAPDAAGQPVPSQMRCTLRQEDGILRFASGLL